MFGLGIGKLGRSRKYLFQTILDVFSTVQIATNIQIPLRLTVNSGEEITIDWGNGSETVVVGTGISTAYNSSYSTAGTFPVKIKGAIGQITEFNITNTTAVITMPSGLSSFNNLSGLITFYLYNLPNLTLTGTMADVPRVTNIFILNTLTKLTLTGLVSDLPSVNSNLTINSSPNVNLDVDTTSIYAYTTTSITLITALTETELRQFLITWSETAGTGTKTITLNGTNAAIHVNLVDDPDLYNAIQLLQSKGKTLLYNTY